MHQAFISGTGRQEDARQLQNGSPSDPDKTELFSPWKIRKKKINRKKYIYITFPGKTKKKALE